MLHESTEHVALECDEEIAVPADEVATLLSIIKKVGLDGTKANNTNEFLGAGIMVDETHKDLAAEDDGTDETHSDAAEVVNDAPSCCDVREGFEMFKSIECATDGVVGDNLGGVVRTITRPRASLLSGIHFVIWCNKQ